MAEELNVGKLVAEIILKAKTDGADEALDAINRVNNTAETINPEIKLSAKLEHEDDLIYIRDVLKTIGIQGEEADRILSSVFSDTSGLQQYKNNIEILASKIELQEKKVLELEAVMSKEPKFKSDYVEIDKATKSIDKERIALQELNAKSNKYFSDHVGIVVKVEGNYVYVVEGNTSGSNDTSSVKQKCYAINNCYINGYYRPNWATVSTDGSNGTRPTYTGKGTTIIKTVQKWCNTEYGTRCNIDGIYGTQTKSAIVGSLQCYLNKAYNAKLVVDGIMGSSTKAAIRDIKQGAKGKYVYILQAALICHGYDTGGFDGEFGGRTLAAVKNWQRKHGLTVDGIAGPETFFSLLK